MWVGASLGLRPKAAGEALNEKFLADVEKCRRHWHPNPNVVQVLVRCWGVFFYFLFFFHAMTVPGTGCPAE